jgi:16S rRNA processing protein RimM
MKKILIAKILKTQGLRGEVKVKTYSLENNVLKEGMQVFLNNNKSLTIKTSRERVGFLYLTFEGYNSIEEVEILRNEDLFTLEENLENLNNNEFYVKDLLGCTVTLNNGDVLGVVEEIENYGASDVYTVTNGKAETIFALVDGLFLEVDLNNKRIVVDKSILEEVMV